MARNEIVLQAFVASPSDVSDERLLLEEVVRELNLTWSKTLGLRVELLKWETHSYPDIGNTSQEVINRQIGDEFDIFIGLMWGKFGTSTGKFGSGTAEEFETAHKIYELGKRKIWIMFYFKDAGIPPSQMDFGQLQSVSAFRSRLGNEGVLYWNFQSKDEFVNLLRLHLSKVVQEWHEKNKSQHVAVSSGAIGAMDLAQPEAAEGGLLDFYESFLHSCEANQQVAVRMTEAMTEIGLKLTARAQELDIANSNTSSPKAATIQAVRRITDNAAHDVAEFAAKIDLEIPHFKESFQTAIDSLTKLAAIQLEFNNDKKPIEDVILASDGLLKVFNEGLPSIALLRKSIVNSPSISAKYMASRQKALGAVDRLINQFMAAIRLLQEAQSIFISLKLS